MSGAAGPAPATRPGLAHRAATAVTLLAVVGLASGCFYQRIKAKYNLPDKVTLVLVDDPTEALGGPRLAGQVANQISFQLVRNKAVPATVPLNRLSQLQRKLGDAYATTPIDELGRTLGAQQVIHVQVVSGTTMYEPGVSRPTATSLVKVIDVERQQRLWPRPSPGVHTAPRGHTVNSSMFYRYTGNAELRGARNDLLQRFATLIGNDIAKLFYDHEPDVGRSAYRDD